MDFYPSNLVSVFIIIKREFQIILNSIHSGKRMCVGDELAKIVLFLYAGRILQQFTISLADKLNLDLDGECGITLVPKPHSLFFQRRQE